MATAVYPGVYQPAPMSTPKQQGQIKSSRPPVNIIEFPEYYQVEMPAPGFRNNDFSVKTRDSSLSIIGNKRYANVDNEAHYHRHGFQAQYISRHVKLPANADTEFGTADYKNGVLNVYLYKTSSPVHHQQSIIIVY